jgi:lysophospholipase L1-like esterase
MPSPFRPLLAPLGLLASLATAALHAQTPDSAAAARARATEERVHTDYVGRGIGGQTTPQMLVRFTQDVIALRPAVVVILAGTNDIAGNTGPSTLEMIQDNLAAMTDLAQAHGIRVVLSSVLPVLDYPWKRGLEPAPRIVALNAWMREFAARRGAVYLDYHAAMRDDRDGMRPELAYDGVHPTEAGFRLMAPLAERAIAEALALPARR